MGTSRLLEIEQTVQTMLDRLFTEALIRRQAGERYFDRGEQYFRSDAVARVSGDESGIVARVIGTEPYLARLWVAERELRWECSCPIGREGKFCKHLVAAGLAWLAGSGREPKAAAEHKRVRQLLGSLDRERLLDLIADRAMWDEPFHEELLLAARALEDARSRCDRKPKSAGTRTGPHPETG